MTIGWFALARGLSMHAARLRAFERYGHWLAPLAMISIGLYILADTATDVAPAR